MYAGKARFVPKCANFPLSRRHVASAVKNAMHNGGCRFDFTGNHWVINGKSAKTRTGTRWCWGRATPNLKKLPGLGAGEIWWLRTGWLAVQEYAEILTLKAHSDVDTGAPWPGTHYPLARRCVAPGIPGDHSGLAERITQMILSRNFGWPGTVRRSAQKRKRLPMNGRWPEGSKWTQHHSRVFKRRFTEIVKQDG